MTIPKVLAILEVSRKQDYIFASKKLSENVKRSKQIAWVTSSAFFEETAPELYKEEENLVNAGGGHTVLQFAERAQAVAFCKKVTEAVLRQFGGMSIFAAIICYDPNKSPSENMLALTAELEKKKARRASSFRRVSYGVERLDETTYLPVSNLRTGDSVPVMLPGEDRCSYPADFSALQLADEDSKDNFIAVVHIDGNAMGTRVTKLYAAHPKDWDACCRSLRRFSEGIQADFEAAFLQMVDYISARYATAEGMLPIRPVILAGDDVCFVCSGKIGLDSARYFLTALAEKENCEQPGTPYAACAGIALVHTKYPFHRAYRLAEQLCDNAKRLGAEIAADGAVSAMDWHIEFGQLRDGLAEQREDYITEDGCSLTLRPVTVVVPERCSAAAEEITGGIRSWEFFRVLCNGMQQEKGKTARSKLKELRTALKQGETESRYYLEDRQTGELLHHCGEALNNTAEKRRAAWDYALHGGSLQLRESAFTEIHGETRCLLFDAIEMMDHVILPGEEACE